jgi:predicted small secreted protein
MEDIMKTAKRIKLVLAALLLTTLLSSCSTTGGYMPLSDNDVVVGTVQTTFLVQSTFFFMQKVKETVNLQAYVKLMETAGQKYPGNIDIRAIQWVTGSKSSDGANTEIFATAKVIQVK